MILPLRALPLVIPSPTLAAAADPLEVFRSGEALPDTAAMRFKIRARIKDHAQTVRGRLQAVPRHVLYGPFTALPQISDTMIPPF